MANPNTYSNLSNDRDPVALLFTDLVGFSTFVLTAGDDTTLTLLRYMADVDEPLIAQHGMVVKRLGDGVMAAFTDTQNAVEAAIDVCNTVAHIRIDGYRPRLRAGIHLGRPRMLTDDDRGVDFLGLDVNIAARVCTAAGPGEVVVSSPTADVLDTRKLRLHSRKPLKAKGVPDGIDIMLAEPRDPATDGRRACH